MHRGFTLIELLVVVAIIAVLASILFPVFEKAREKANQTTCVNNQRQIVAATQMYLQDNDEIFPNKANFWQVLNIPSGVKVCATQPTSALANTNNTSYGYNTLLSTQTLGFITQPAFSVVVADSNNPKNQLSSPADVSLRHTNQAICAYVDGHVAASATIPLIGAIPEAPVANGLLLWLMGDNGVAISGTRIPMWADMSGLNNNATQGTVNNQPSYVSSGLNGLPIVSFNEDSARYLKFPEQTTVRTVFWVLDETRSFFGDCLLADSASTPQTPFNQYNGPDVFCNSPDAGMAVRLNGTALASYWTTLMPLNSWNMITACTSTNAKVNNLAWDRMAVNGDNYTFDGNLAEILVYNRVLSAQEINTVETYLNSKWGLGFTIH